MESRQGSTASGAGDDDSPVLVQRADAYFGSGAWARELSQASLAAWGVGETASFIRAIGAGEKQRGDHERIARIVEEESITGALLEAGGPGFLGERIAPVLRRWSTSQVKIKAAKIVRALREECALRAGTVSSYWERNPAVAAIYGACDLTETLRDALAPQPRSAVRFCHLRGLATLDVDEVDSEVMSACDPGSAERFKIVCASLASSPTVINHNFLYARNADDSWVLVLSIDFMQHGSAAPGHWHLNRAPLGELLPHWGPRYEVVHGDPRACPLWWHLIPEGTTYKATPRRPELLAGAEEDLYGM
jgi:hypothetical protein